MKQLRPSWDTLLIVAITLITSICAQSQAQEAAEGKVVAITPDADAVDLEPGTRIAREPSYWIGIRGHSIESAVLRTHLQLAEDMGVVVEAVIPESPGAKAGLRKHDIILRANGDAVDNMQVLQSQVRSGKANPLELRIIRLGKQEDLVVIPELRPQQFSELAPGLPTFQGIENGELMQQLIEQLGARNIGPGMLFQGGGQGLDVNQIPSGVSVSIHRNNDEPAQITVKQGDSTWHIEGDDEESLNQLPADVRLFVQRMLMGPRKLPGFSGGRFEFGDFNDELQRLLPRGLGGFGRRAEQHLRLRGDDFQADMKERMEALEQRLLELQRESNRTVPQLPSE